jgi:hypothetical protein
LIINQTRITSELRSLSEQNNLEVIDNLRWWGHHALRKITLDSWERYPSFLNYIQQHGLGNWRSVPTNSGIVFIFVPSFKIYILINSHTTNHTCINSIASTLTCSQYLYTNPIFYVFSLYIVLQQTMNNNDNRIERRKYELDIEEK